MTMQITRSRRRASWQGALRVLIIAVIIFFICLILLDLISGFLVDWLWFSAIGYFDVCVPKTLSTLMRWQNRLSWRNDWVAVFIPCSRDRAMQVEEPA